MLQRIQSIYLGLVFTMCVGLFFIPLSLVIVSNPDPVQETIIMMKLTGFTKTIAGKLEVLSVPYLQLALVSVIALLALASVFQYKNRSRQMLFCRINMVLLCLLAVSIFWMEDVTKKEYSGKLTYLYGSYLPPIQLIMTYLAQRAIKKDDDLIRSADRLR